MKTRPCMPYDARLDGLELLGDGTPRLKLYYVSIVGRDGPERYEWGRSPVDRNLLAERLLEAFGDGVGFGVAFPHIAKLFRFSPSAETVIDVAAFAVEPFGPLDLSAEGGFSQFGCLAETVIAAAEHEAWALAGSVEDYLRAACERDRFAIHDNAKLGRYARELG